MTMCRSFYFILWLLQALKCQIGWHLKKQPQIKYDVYPDYCTFNIQYFLFEGYSTWYDIHCYQSRDKYTDILERA